MTRARRRADPYNPPAPATWDEYKLQAAIIKLITTLNERLIAEHPVDEGMRLLVFHDRDSRRNVRGFPDLFIAGCGGHAVAELKSDATGGKLRPEQRVWLQVLARGGAPVYEWRPVDWAAGTIQNVLYKLARPRVHGPALPGTYGLPVPAGPARRAARCGCPFDDDGRIGAHTCETFGPPPAR